MSILVAYDGSNAAEKALRKACELVKDNGQLFVVSVVPSTVIHEFADLDPELSKARAQSKLNHALKEVKHSGINVIGVIREGDIAEEILQMGKKLGCELIVVGHKGVSKIGKFSLGSVAEKVVRYATIPVLVVR